MIAKRGGEREQGEGKRDRQKKREGEREADDETARQGEIDRWIKKRER